MSHHRGIEYQFQHLFSDVSKGRAEIFFAVFQNQLSVIIINQSFFLSFQCSCEEPLKQRMGGGWGGS